MHSSKVPLGSTWFHCALWSTFGLPRILSFTTFPRSVQDTVPEDVLTSCGCSSILTLTLPQWVYRMVRVPRNLDCTRLGDRSPLPWSKEVWTQPKFSIWMIRETFRDDSQIRIRDKKINPDGWKGMLWLPVNVSWLNLSLFLAFPLHSNVDTARYYFAVRNWRISPKNGNLVEEWTSWTE